MQISSKALSQCAIFAALIAILAQISIPFVSGVPFTLQTFIVLLLGFLLGGRLSVITTVLYLLIGAIGFPVFAHLTGGFPILFGPTGGFLLSFPLMAAIVGFSAQRTNSRPLLFAATLAAISVNLLCGTFQFMLFSDVSFTTAMVACF
ncbi:MAG: biotin transporter BioY, partial [Culicoidibacterales bacterium]